MKKKFVTVLFILLPLASCKIRGYKQKILGDWQLSKATLVDSSKLVPPLGPPGLIGFKLYSFGKGDTCYNKIGYFDKSGNWTTQTKYMITNDTLSIFDPTSNYWDNWKIDKLTKDTLEVNNRRSRYLCAKQVTKNISRIPVDEIVLSSYSGWGFVNDVIINGDGSVFYRKFGQTNEYFTSEVTTHDQELIWQGFGSLDLLSLNDDYSTAAFDAPEIDITFIRDKKIIKIIHDYDWGGPINFVSAYLPLKYLYQHLKLVQDNDTSSKPDLRFINFRRNNYRTDMLQSVQYYLLNLIRNAKETQTPFSKKYELICASNNVLKVETDGRIYQVTWKKGGQTSYDIGFNFIDINQDKIKFTKLYLR